MINEELLSILACPKCKGPVVYIKKPDPAIAAQTAQPQEHLDCSHCRLRYEIKDDIPVMLIDEAKSY
ncbi:MAG: Trm112 family protein [Elusimicrobia bacterium]|nr:Trm112 family protein [Elusimicrobiota bacterium]